MRKVDYKEKGITLIALVVTIIILLILAGITLTTALGQNGLFERAKYAVEKYKESEADEAEKLGEVEKEIDKIIEGKDPAPPDPPEVEKGPNGKPLLKTVTSTEHDTETYEDSLGNPVVIPGGFKFAGNSDDTVQDGIIIEDDEENQFIWIPVSNINGDNDTDTKEEGSIEIIKKDKTTVEITLGRYTFKSEGDSTIGYTDGTPTLVQKGEDHSERSDKTKITLLGCDYYEDTNEQERTNGGIEARDLEGFVQSVKMNHGYYLARYEAGKGENDKPVSKVGEVWVDIKAEEASRVSIDMYSEGDRENEFVISDLVNSYAWDTAIVFIQAMGHANYANMYGSTEDGGPRVTGVSNDEVCHIFDMSGSFYELTTEYCSYEVNHWPYKFPYVCRGGWNGFEKRRF